MKTKRSAPKNIDEYIACFPKDVQAILEKIRATIRKAAPDAEEKISYQMPTFALKGNLVHFAAWKEHIGFYPAPTGIEAFKTELSAYEGAKGSVQFPLDRPIPYDLIGRIVEYRVKENLEKAATRRARGGRTNPSLTERRREGKDPAGQRRHLRCDGGGFVRPKA
jgi:uncharacterized protein YdhG (YjbR/CyaY superfamily)